MKAKYTYSWPSEPVLTVASPGLFRLEQPWRCTRTAQDGSEKTWTVPAGFITDFASIPRLFWSVQGFPMDRYHLHAALLHDWRYALGGGKSVRKDAAFLHDSMYYAQGGGKNERKDADKDYRRMLRQAGLGPVKAWREYRALRLFGASHFALAAIALAVLLLAGACRHCTANFGLVTLQLQGTYDRQTQETTQE